VQRGDVLAHIDSREVGEAKLKLVQDKLALLAAQKAHRRHKTIYENTTSLLATLEAGKTPQEIQKQFRERPIGSYREQLVSTLVRFRRAEADYERYRSLGDSAVVPERVILRAKAELDASHAAHQAVIEQIGFDGEQRSLVAQQRLREAEAAAAISRSQLLILGYGSQDIDAMDPIAEADQISYYPVRAPLDGKVVARPALLSSHTDARTTLVEIADLSTLWLRADVFDKDLAAVQDLKGKSVSFRTTGYPGRQFTATVFTVGNLVDNETRAARLLAEVDNSERLLKAGMFVAIELGSGEDQGILQAPASAIQRHDGATFVFVQRGPEEFERRDVRIKRSTRETVEIADGLLESESVVVNGGFALKSKMLSELMTEE
jgi:RND family efflux transporter MFP subunit